MRKTLVDNEDVILKTCLFNSKPIILNPDLAMIFGDSNMALIFQQLHYWISFNKDASEKGIAKIDTFYEGRYWCFQTLDDWEKEFPWIDKRTVRRKFKKLEEMGVVIIGNFNKINIDRTKWYTINYKKLLELQDKVLTKKISEKENKVLKRKQQEKAAIEKFKKNKSKKNVDKPVNKSVDNVLKNSNFRNGQNVHLGNGQNVHLGNGQNVHLEMDKMSIAIQETNRQEINDIQEINIGQKTNDIDIGFESTKLIDLEVEVLKSLSVLVEEENEQISEIAFKLSNFKPKEYHDLIRYVADAFDSNKNIKSPKKYIKGIVRNAVFEGKYIKDNKKETVKQKNKFFNYEQKDYDHEKIKKMQYEILKRDVGEIEEDEEENKIKNI